MGMLEDALREYAKFVDRTDDPTTPGTDEALVYVKNGKIHSVDDAGTVTEYGSGGGGGTFVGASASLAANQTIASGVNTPIEWDTSHYDEGGLLDLAGANPERLTIPTGEGGKYRVVGAITFATPSGTVSFTGYVAVNGTQTHRASTDRTDTPSALPYVADLDLAAGDYIEILARQSTGGNHDVAGNASRQDTYVAVSKLG